MAIYAIGDVQGCYDELMRLLDKIAFDPDEDRLWFAGDLINRGPKSLKTLRFIRDLGKSARVVLGNHDLHALAIYHGSTTIKMKDTIERLLIAHDSDALFSWLAQQPLAVYSKKRDCLMVHAGVPHNWSLDTVLNMAEKVQKQLRDPNKIKALLDNMYGNQPDHWRDGLNKVERNRYIINALTRMRFCYHDGRLDLSSKLSPSAQKTNLLPWFDLPNKKLSNTRIVFGHWAALMGETGKDNIFALDTGCVWGNQLTAMNLKTLKRDHVNSQFRAEDY